MSRGHRSDTEKTRFWVLDPLSHSVHGITNRIIQGTEGWSLGSTLGLHTQHLISLNSHTQEGAAAGGGERPPLVVQRIMLVDYV